MLTKEQIDFITTNNDDDSQTGLPEPEHTIQVIRSLNEKGDYIIDYKQLNAVSKRGNYIVRFEDIDEMFDFIADQIG